MERMEQRTVLSNCCEWWILQWGEFYGLGKEFVCLPCGHKWRKDTTDAFTELTTSVSYRVVVTNGFEQLEPIGNPAPILNRCCSTILIEYGRRVEQLPFSFQCPVCNTPWKIDQDPVLSLVRLYIKVGDGTTFRLQESPIANFLDPVDQRIPVA